ncbi:MAG: hypothetical protein KDA57_16910 [Planctomycetales bacterium]|nr:hypothetical protein [Planctomycetales bacterium]
MPSGKYPEEGDSGQDSFLDVVANVVGVLIILVMLVGVRASHSLFTAKTKEPAVTQETSLADEVSGQVPQDLAELRQALDQAQKQAIASHRENEQLTFKLAKLTVESAAHDQRRAELAMHRTLIEEDLEKRRSQLDLHKQQEFDVQRQLVEAQLKLDEITKEQLTLAMAPAPIEEVECVPTPLARTVEGESIHLRLQKGLVSIVPLEELLHEVENRVVDIRRRLQSRDEVVETIGPLNGYRLRFTVAKSRSVNSVMGPRVGLSYEVTHEQFAQVLPVSDDLGQTVEQALMPGAVLYERLHFDRRQRPSVVIWLYTDSFDEFRPLKRELWKLGATVAVRPMQPGALIGASPHGTKSAAQ